MRGASSIAAGGACADNINAAVAGIVPYQPGKPVETLELERGVRGAVKLASNENPRGPSPRVRQALRAATAALSRYPDGNGTRLKDALAEHLGVGADRLTLGNGSSDVLELASRVAISPGTSGVVDQHCFLVYPKAVTAANGVVRRVPSARWGHDLEALAAAVDDTTRIVFIANPNNPTGTWVEEAALARFLSAVPRRVWVVLDEAYGEYASDRVLPDGLRLAEAHANLIVTRTFSKIHGLAALRVGYAVSSPEFADLMNRIRQPFNVGSLALAAAQAALADTEFVAESRRLNTTGMACIERGLRALGLHWIPSRGNFVTFDLGEGRDAGAIYEAMLDDGVIVRPVANYGMARHLRVTVGLADENARFLQALERALAR